MAMEFGKLSNMSVGQVTKSVAEEGGMVVTGLLGSGFVGKQLENMIKKGVVPTSTITDKLFAYGANNVPKMVIWYLLRKEGGAYLKGYEKDVAKGVLASVVLDTLIRVTNQGAPKASIVLWGHEMLSGTPINELSNMTPQLQENLQKVLQENGSLRNQLNSALQRIASASPNVTVTPQTATTPAFPPDHDRAYGMMDSTPESQDRRKNFGSMTPPIQAERNRKFGAMDKAQMNFAGETESVSAAFGML